MKKLTIVVPCFNEEEVLDLFYETVKKETEKIKALVEYVFVDDGSKDKTLQIIKKIKQKDVMVQYVSFARNFGKEAGIYAGLKYATGDYVVVMDADLQHDPKLLKEMYQTITLENYETVAVKRVNRKKEKMRGFCSKWFFKIMSNFSGFEMKMGEMDYRMMSRKMVETILQMSEYNRFSKGIFSWVGYETKWLEQENVERTLGETKWNFKKLVSYSIHGITAFSTKPLLFASFIGFIFCIGSFVAIMMTIIKTLVFGEHVDGYPTLMCCMFLIGGIQLFCFGIMGEYIAKMYLEIKGRPIYIAKETSYEKN